ncbi:sensor histidine kinase N-terminal domain-containing protein [Acidovorax sp. JG5]|uniref:sensor histidine kinase n=1 Tax=Acidovorax sp. JG5 TaxID=2822718 RepID=UPI001B325AEA|nr:sensor histidine kinase [Acidovorax sp. JG5]MBP3979809.1 sensor histidine kinase N-terminal domain-containing protein [Acidovorax sp. JG5]
MTSDLRNRLLLLLVLPLCLLALLGVWMDYRTADETAARHDQRLLRLLPALADSVLAPGSEAGGPPVWLLAPPVEDFLRQNAGVSGFSVRDMSGRLLLGDAWVHGAVPLTQAPEFHSVEVRGITYRVAVQRGPTGAGEMVVALADGSDPRQQWAQHLLLRVLLPNLVLVAAAALAIHWAVGRAFKPLVDLAAAVERRSPRDLSAIDETASPAEVRPLVHSLNRLFALVNMQAESQRRFVADAAHQLRTPLAGLQAQVEAWALLARSGGKVAGPSGTFKPDEPQALGGKAVAAITLGASEIEKLRAATRRTSQLAHQLLALSRADARSLDAQAMQRVDVRDLCENLLEMYLDAATGKGIDLGLDAQPVHVYGHGWLLRELLSNLVDNAIKYTRAGGSVTIRCAIRPDPQGGASAFLQVEDDGPGVPPAERAHVLQRFYRVPGTEGEGTGLGLPIADEIARAHGATLTLEPGASGRGLRVTLVFPA